MAPPGLDPDDALPPPHGPYQNPVDRYAQLPESTRRFIERLDEEDIAELNEMRLSFHRAKTIGWFFKWLVITVIGAFMGAVAFGESVIKSAEWLGRLFGRGS